MGIDKPWSPVPTSPWQFLVARTHEGEGSLFPTAIFFLQITLRRQQTAREESDESVSNEQPKQGGKV
jgi:hypothetical protein